MSRVKKALRQFTFGSRKTADRNSSGRIMSFHRGGGAKRLQPTVDLKRNTTSSLGVVEQIEYDLNRSSDIALVRWLQGVHRRRRASAGIAACSSKLLALNPAITNSDNIRGMSELNSMLPRVGTSTREVFLSAFSSKAKGQDTKSELESVSLIGLSRCGCSLESSVLRATWKSGGDSGVGRFSKFDDG
ncbi:60S ribosomal protein [Vigna angularis]|uniref:60S ribosomal protein L2, mitochondrial n=1 Tax=Phaseolus angularis TaxID=3914 RepID=A0A8T0KZI7_PHAAN|nr:60S ribosomal protein [Vigna angularis]